MLIDNRKHIDQQTFSTVCQQAAVKVEFFSDYCENPEKAQLE